MHICSKCGAHYSNNFLACPQCGNSRFEVEMQETTGSKIFSGLVSVLLVGALLGIIGFGVYFLYNPITEGDVITDVDWEANGISTTLASSKNSNSTSAPTTGETTTRSTTTALVGETYSHNGQSITLPNGFKGSTMDGSSLGYSSIEFLCATNNSDSNNQYCFNVMKGYNFSARGTSLEQLNAQLKSMGMTEVVNGKFNNKSFYYSYKKLDDGYIFMQIYMNKGSNYINASGQFKAEEINDESTATFISILNTYKY